MALTKCTECGQQVSNKAAACPNCGAPVGSNQPKKKKPSSVNFGTIAFLVAAGLFIVVYEFGLKTQRDFKNSPAPAENQQTQPESNPPQLDVLTVPQDLIEGISSGLEQPFTMRHAYAAKSLAHKNVYFIAAEMVGPGANGEVGLWAKIGELDSHGLIHSVNGFAVEFSDWPDSSKTKADISQYDPPARLLVGFVQEQVRASR